MNGHEARALVRRLIVAFPGVTIDPETPSLYEQWMLDLPHAAADEVVDELIAHSTHLPTIAEIRRRVFEQALELPEPLEAWRSLNDPDDKTHPLVVQVAQLFGGTYNIRTADEPTIMRAQFLKAYGAWRDEELRRANVSAFRGLRKTA